MATKPADRKIFTRAGVATAVAGMTLAVTGLTVAPAGADAPNDHQIEICHATGNGGQAIYDAGCGQGANVGTEVDGAQDGDGHSGQDQVDEFNDVEGGDQDSSVDDQGAVPTGEYIEVLDSKVVDSEVEDFNLDAVLIDEPGVHSDGSVAPAEPTGPVPPPSLIPALQITPDVPAIAAPEAAAPEITQTEVQPSGEVQRVVPAVRQPVEVLGVVYTRQLARTGSDSLPLAELGFGLLLLGGAAILAGRFSSRTT